MSWIILLSFGSVYSQGALKEPDWLRKMNDIRILVDTYEDVLRILGNPEDQSRERESLETFILPSGELSVGFVFGGCSTNPDGQRVGWKVPPYTVWEVSFSPHEWIDPSKLGLAGFKDFRAANIHGGREGIEYSNDETGVTYIVNRGKIQTVIFYPRKEQDHLQCK